MVERFVVRAVNGELAADSPDFQAVATAEVVAAVAVTVVRAVFSAHVVVLSDEGFAAVGKVVDAGDDVEVAGDAKQDVDDDVGKPFVAFVAGKPAFQRRRDEEKAAQDVGVECSAAGCRGKELQGGKGDSEAKKDGRFFQAVVDDFFHGLFSLGICSCLRVWLCGQYSTRMGGGRSLRSPRAWFRRP